MQISITLLKKIDGSFPANGLNSWILKDSIVYVEIVDQIIDQSVAHFPGPAFSAKPADFCGSIGSKFGKLGR